MATPPDFTAGAVLTAAQMNKIGLWLVKTQTIGTSVTSVTVNDAFSADYDSYKIIVSGGVASAAASVSFRLGGSTTGYYGTLIYSAYTAASGLFLTDNNATLFSYAGSVAANGISINIDVTNPGRADRTFIQGLYATPGTASEAGRYQGFHNVATAYTSFVIASTAALTGGEIKVYGYRN